MRQLLIITGTMGTGKTMVLGLAGVWRNTEVKNSADSLVELQINGLGPGYNVEPFGKCPQGECSWSMHTVFLEGGQAAGEWTPQNTPRKLPSGELSLSLSGRAMTNWM